MEKMEFDKLIDKYDKFMKKYPPEKINKADEENIIIDVDITRIGKDIENINSRIEQMQEELSNIDNSPFALEYPDQIKAMKEDKENQIFANREFIKEKEEKI